MSFSGQFCPCCIRLFAIPDILHSGQDGASSCPQAPWLTNNLKVKLQKLKIWPPPNFGLVPAAESEYILGQKMLEANILKCLKAKVKQVDNNKCAGSNGRFHFLL
ncbi:hypothetical protein I79_014723 [Cricetulus griseus]|uniref:Uncharacterized protein n=1 Tax=Cricetulus griseus TaxID=10029 RepID=G3HUV5_CRIGR|nr:hypothetical protein I79_014723 [Cricetulus griseus]